MKRKFKLIASIASLTAAVALLMFGVYAAATRTVEVGGSVTFIAENIMATVTIEHKLPGATDFSFATGTGVTDGQIVYTLGTAGNQPEEVIAELANATFTEDNTIYTVRVTITNDFTGTEAVPGLSIHIVFTAPGDPSLKGVVYQEDISGGVETATDDLAYGETATYLFTYTLDPATASNFENVDIDLSFVMTRVTA